MSTRPILPAAVSAPVASPMPGRSNSVPLWVTCADVLTLALTVLAALVFIDGGFRTKVLGVRLFVATGWRPVLWASLVFGVRHLAFRRRSLPRRLADAGLAGIQSIAQAVRSVRGWCRDWQRPVTLVCLRLLAFSALSTPAVLYVALPLGWERNHRSPLTGDEPHYVVVADAIVHDHGLDVEPAYDRDAINRRIAGPIDWRNHSLTRGSRSFSIHGIGVPVLVAPLFALLGIEGVRLTLGLLAGPVPFLFFGIARLRGETAQSPACDSHCSVGTYFYIDHDNRPTCLTSFLDLERLLVSAGELKSSKRRGRLFQRISALAQLKQLSDCFDEARAPEGLSFLRLLRGLDGWEDKSVGRARRWFKRGFNGMFVAGMHFMDSTNYSARRVRRCIIKDVTTDGRVLSFCRYNAGERYRTIEDAHRLGMCVEHGA